MSRLIEKFWKRAGVDLGIKIEAPFDLALKDGSVLRFEVLVKDFGAKLGMLITTDHTKIKKSKEELESLEYGYSVMSDYSTEDSYNLEGFKYMLKDWGWSGNPELAPVWLENVSDPYVGYNYSDED